MTALCKLKRSSCSGVPVRCLLSSAPRSLHNDGYNKWCHAHHPQSRKSYRKTSKDPNRSHERGDRPPSPGLPSSSAQTPYPSTSRRRTELRWATGPVEAVHQLCRLPSRFAQIDRVRSPGSALLGKAPRVSSALMEHLSPMV